jgi:hypothetical protein
MQITERGNSIKLIRTTYDPKAKAPTSEIVAKVQRPDLELTEAERAKLTPEELEQFEAYCRTAMRTINIEREYAALRLPETLEMVSEWLSAAPREEALAFGSKIQKPLKKLRRKIDSLTNTGDAPLAKPGKKRGPSVAGDDDEEDG